MTLAKRPKRAHVQLDMLNKSGTAVRDPRGGYRPGAGRKPAKGKRRSEPHRVRPAIKASEPQHVVMRVVRAVGSLRGFAIYRALRNATVSAARHEAFRIVHISIQDTHVHMLVEATDRIALAKGVQGFQISAAKWINRALGKGRDVARVGVRGEACEGARGGAREEARVRAIGPRRAVGEARGHERGKSRKGQVFVDRYFAESITCPRYARNALAYVLNNWRKHREDGRLEASTWLVDPFSSGGLFDGWKELEERGLARWTLREDYVPLTVREPQTWLLRVGWKRHGLIRCREIPRTIR